MKPMLVLTVLLSLILSACENPVKRMVRNAEYSGYELLGVQKRDLLKRDIQATRANEKEAAETFKDSLEKLRKLYAMPESELSRQYTSIQSAYEVSEQKAKDVRQSREAMETVAHDLFREWEGEIAQMQAPDLKAGSRGKLNESRQRFAGLDRSLTQAEKKMDPVLVRLKDHVLYLKHNLNAESLAQLKKERDRIDGDISALIQDMSKSIVKADEFIKTIR